MVYCSMESHATATAVQCFMVGEWRIFYGAKSLGDFVDYMFLSQFHALPSGKTLDVALLGVIYFKHLKLPGPLRLCFMSDRLRARTLRAITLVLVAGFSLRLWT